MRPCIHLSLSSERERALQVAWMNGLMDFVFPYLIQFLKEYTGKVDNLWKEKKERQVAAVDEESAKKQQEAQTNAYLQLMPLALPAPPGVAFSLVASCMMLEACYRQVCAQE